LFDWAGSGGNNMKLRGGQHSGSFHGFLKEKGPNALRKKRKHLPSKGPNNKQKKEI